MKRTAICIALLAAIAFGGFAVSSYAKGSDEDAIRKLNADIVNAMKTKDLNTIMSFYQQSGDMVAFDVIPPLQYAGYDAYKKDWQEFVAMFPGAITVEQSQLKIDVDGNMAYARSIEHLAGDIKGGKLDFTVRLTDVFRKINGKWLIVHEHVSVPVDLVTGKADLQSK